MNFFEHQAAARRSSARLLALFSLAVVSVVLAVDLVAWSVAGSNVTVLAWCTVLTLLVIGMGSLYRLASLGRGGESIAMEMGGEPAPEDSTDPDLRRFRNVVEEMAIASGVPMPRLYVLEHDAGINAFAAGYSPSDAVVAVTRGALERLNRDELQAVVAHEFSHILNGDMRLNLRLVGVLFGISMIALIGHKVLHFGLYGSRDGGRGPTAAIFMMAGAVVALVVGWIGLFFARMIRAGISRSRERLADASAVQFTRQTTGLAGALKKIAGLPDGSHLFAVADAEEISHMLFGEGLRFGSLFGPLLATHPPVLERIKALDPSFTNARLDTLARRWMDHPPHGLEEDVQLGLHDGTPLPASGAAYRVDEKRVSGHVGQPDATDYRHAGGIVAAIPEELRVFAADREKVMPLILGLLLDDQKPIADKQLFGVGARLGRAVAVDLATMAEPLRGLHPALRMPLAALAFPVLRRRPRPELELFLDAANAMVLADGSVSLFEYCLGRLLTVQLRESLDPSRYARTGRRSPPKVKQEIAIMLAVVASYGHPDAAVARRAYIAGMQRILPQATLPYVVPPQGVLALEDVWVPLDSLDPLAKRLLVEAITLAIGHDGRVTVAESELLRTVCGVLHCPLPPMLAQA
ncbi:M48 family metallopeptidase [Lysobacter ciconiae]|uniref:M48 family metallopeptidase n=1 Tax=Novilysobacter ciconiae TaxID=2781022 RepID=A0A7S6ZS08_9GAMM|nr:M48 family metallopeptidase [Lysobacter ciconiae]QOW19368.1 M48 family metallopeptidase [Lysobacter ciconiae]